MCVAVVGQFFMVLACVVQADCLSVNTSVPCELCCFKSLARGFINQTDISTEQETDDFCFVSFCFFNGTHGFATVRCLWLNAWVLFCFSSWWYVTLLRVCLSDWRKMLGSNGFFSVKLGNLMTHLPKHPRLNIWYDPFILPRPDVSSLPNLMVVIFFSCNLLLHVLYILRPHFQFVFGIFYGVTRPAKGFF